jgi:uncharacterized protein (TIGR03437 family)
MSLNIVTLSNDHTGFPTIVLGTLLLIFLTAAAGAAPRDRITSPVDPDRTRIVPGNISHRAQPQYDQGEVDPSRKIDYVVLVTKRTTEQQAELDTLLADQQNPSSPRFHAWLSPEEFGNRFGLSTGDQAKIAGWLRSRGLMVQHVARSQNWIAFSGSAAQVASTLHTSFHRFQVDGESHFGNVSEPSVPEALAEVVDGFLGLDDFRLKPGARLVPDYNVGTAHYLTPQDFATIYNITPLYQAGIDGTGQAIAVVGESDVQISDLRKFKTMYGLPQNDPLMFLYGTDPGFNGAEVEGNLDLEWSSAIAPKATIYYVYGGSAFTAIVIAVELNVAPIITISYGFCEVNYSSPYYRSIAQQGNAQGITLLSASGDSGAAGCQDRGPSATRGRSVQFPASLPEVTGVGGTQFVEGTGNYWAPTNSATFGSALSYIPEAAWNESTSAGLASGGGGASILYSKPAWQAGPGVPNDSARDVPDIALSAAGHDAYYIDYLGNNDAIFGTSASAPSMAGIIALLNQYQVANRFQKIPGLGNINPQLYRLAQTAPSVFHDITAGSNIVPCAQGSPDCDTGSFGYLAGPGYDMATGLGSLDANALVTNWNTATSGVIVTLTSSAARATINDTIQLTARVVPATGSGSPTGTVNFTFDTVALGSAPLTNGSASVSVPVYLFGGIGSLTLAAEYLGDASFSPGGATLRFQATSPVGAAGVLISAPNTVWPQPADAAGLSWQTTITLQEVAGVPAMVTGFMLDGQAQSLPQYFPSPNLLPKGTLTLNVVFRGLTPPVTRTFGFTGVDAFGNTWSRQASIIYGALLTYDYGNVALTPLVVEQNPSADPSCQWSAQLNLDDLGGYGIYLVTGLFAGGVDLTSQISSILGTTRLDAFGGLQGTLCFNGITPPATEGSAESIQVNLSNGTVADLTLSFTGPAPNPGKLSSSPSNITLSSSSASQPATTTLAVTLSDKTQSWTAAVYPANRTTSWLTLSQLSGVGTASVTLTTNATGFEPGAYRATIVIQSQNAIPQYINVPVMFVLGASASTKITSVGNSFSFQGLASPGMLLSITGTQLANSTATATGNPYPNALAGVSVTVNGLAAPILYVSSTFVNVQIPYAVGAGPAVLGLNNNGQVAGFPLQIAASAPGIFVDRGGNIGPTPTAQQGGYGTIFYTGAGEISPALKTGYSPSVTAAPSSQPIPLLPVSVTVGNVPVLLQYSGLAPGLIGTAQVNFIVPTNVPVGVQPVVVTVGGVASPPANLNVTTAPASTPSQ